MADNLARKFFKYAKRGDFKGIKSLARSNKRFMAPLALLVGFIGDLFTLNNIEQLFDQLILLTHFLLVALSIILLFSLRTAWGKKMRLWRYEKYAHIIMPFSLGGLFSGFFIFYFKSASILTSWPFVLALVVFMILVEWKKYYLDFLEFQIGIYSIVAMAYFIFVVPLLFNAVGMEIFLLSSLISVLYIGGLLYLLYRIHPIRIRLQWRKLAFIAGGIIGLFQLLYFTNVIPPIPLALKFTQAYYVVERHSSDYRAVYEPTALLNVFQKRKRTLYYAQGEPIYVFASVFAPAKISTDIVHEWAYRDKEKGKWITTDVIGIPIVGGRKSGYRGFSKKTSLSEGKWRVRIRTSRGQNLGQVKFRLDSDHFVKRTIEEKL